MPPPPRGRRPPRRFRGAPAFGDKVARAPRRLLRGLAFEGDPDENDAQCERKGAEDQDERDEPRAERGEKAPREPDRARPDRSAGEKERNDDEKGGLPRREGGARHRERRLGRRGESDEAGGGGQYVHAPQAVERRDRRHGLARPAGAFEDTGRQLDALAAGAGRPSDGVPLEPLD